MNDLMNRILSKHAANGNPAAPVKQSLPTGPGPSVPKVAPYLNQGGGQAPTQKPGETQKQPQPWPGYVNIGDKKPGTQTAGDLGAHGAPDTGERGTSFTGDTKALTKSASFWAGVESQLTE